MPKGVYKRNKIIRRLPPNMWTFCDDGCYTDLKHGRCWISWEDWPKVKNYRWYSQLTPTKRILISSTAQLYKGIQ